MAHYVNVSMPKAHAVALLGLARLGRNGLIREQTLEERKALESLEYVIEGMDRRKVNRRATVRKHPLIDPSQRSA